MQRFIITIEGHHNVVTVMHAVHVPIIENVTLLCFMQPFQPTPLHACARKGHEDVVKLLLKQKGTKLNAGDCVSVH